MGELLYPIIGICTFFGTLVWEWFEGEDVSIGELLTVFGLSIIWPMFWAILSVIGIAWCFKHLSTSSFFNYVLFKGRKKGQ